MAGSQFLYFFDDYPLANNQHDLTIIPEDIADKRILQFDWLGYNKNKVFITLLSCCCFFKKTVPDSRLFSVLLNSLDTLGKPLEILQ